MNVTITMTWLDLWYQLRLASAEWLIDVSLSVMPPGMERGELAALMMTYFSKRRAQLRRELHETCDAK